MWRKEAPQIFRTIVRVGQRAFAGLKEVRGSRSGRRKMAMRLNARWRRNFPAPVYDSRDHAAVFCGIERDAVRICCTLGDEREHEILRDGEVLDAVRDGPVLRPRLKV